MHQQAAIATLVLMVLTASWAPHNEVGRALAPDIESEQLEAFLNEIRLKARDHCRSPIQWDSKSHGGFTTGTPWMRVNDDYTHHNAKQQLSDPNSVHAYWKQVLQVRKTYSDTVIYGDFRLLDREHDAVLGYQRTACHGVITVITNFTEKQQMWETPDEFPVCWTMSDVILANYPPPAAFAPGRMLLRPFEALVIFEQS